MKPSQVGDGLHVVNKSLLFCQLVVEVTKSAKVFSSSTKQMLVSKSKKQDKTSVFFSGVDLFGKLYIIFWQNQVCWSLERFLFWRNLHFCFQPSRFGNRAILNFWLALSKTFTLNFFFLYRWQWKVSCNFNGYTFFHKDSNGRTNDVINGIESCEKQLFLSPWF